MNDRQPLILLHGALGAASQFDTFLPLLRKHFEVHTLNFSGHGGLPPIAGVHTIQTFTSELDQFIMNRELDRICLFGYSMGGYVALNYAGQHQDRIRSVFTLGTKFDWSPETANRETAMLVPETMERKVPGFVRTLAERHAPTSWKSVVSLTAALLTDLGNQPLDESFFQSLRCRVRIAVGDRDQMAGIEPANRVFRMIPGASFLVLPETPHPLEQVNQERLVQELETFFIPDN